MEIHAFGRHTIGNTGSRLRPCFTVVLAWLIFFAQLASAAQQAPPNKPALQPASKTPSPLADSQELLQQGKFEDARIRIQEELQQNPLNAQGYALLGRVYTAENNYPEALTAFQQGLKLNPKSTGIHNDLGNLYVAQGNLDLAEKEFRVVLRLSPADYDGNYNLSLVLLTKKHPADALPFSQRSHPPTIASRITLTRAYLDARRTAEGLKAAQELSAQNKENVQVHLTLDVLLAAEKQHRAAQLELEQAKQALDVAQQVSSAGQQDDAFLSLLADIKAHLGQPPEASQIYRSAIRRNPDNDQYYLSLTLLQLRQNDLGGAQ